MKRFVFILAFLFTLGTFGQGEDLLNPLKGKKVIYVWGGWPGHKPKESVDFFVPWLKSEGAIVTVSNSLDIYTDKEIMSQVDLIIQNWSMGKINSEQFQGLLDAVIDGAGFAGWHGGMADAFRDNLEYQFLVGGIFLSHPGGFVDFEVNIVDSQDPITYGIKDFSLKKTEQYYMLVDPNVKVLATTTFDQESYPLYEWRDNKMIESKDRKLTWITGNKIPVVWKKNYGKGRVFYSSIGHFLSDFDVTEAFEIQKRGIRWAANGKQN